MMILGTFPHSLELEQALNELEREGIPRRHLLVVCMDTEPKPPLPEVIRSREPRSKEIETGFACATGLSVIGASVGFALPPGPILCGLLAAVLGFGLGFWAQSVYLRKSRPHRSTAEEAARGDDRRPMRGAAVLPDRRDPVAIRRDHRRPGECRIVRG